MTTLNLSNLKINSHIIKTSTHLKLKACTILLILDMMLEVVLLEIYKLNKLSGPIPQISCFAYIHLSCHIEACIIT